MKKTFKMVVAGFGVGVVSLAGVGLASAHFPSGDDRKDSILSRVAEILDVDSNGLNSAFEQARDEYRDAKLDKRLTMAVEDGTIAQEDADHIRDWLDVRPDVLEHLKGKGRGPGQTSAGLEERLHVLIEDGTITKTDADAAIEWFDGRPEAMELLRSEKGGRAVENARSNLRRPSRGIQQWSQPGSNEEFRGFGEFRF